MPGWRGAKDLELPPRKSRAEILAAAFRHALWALMLPVIILVGLRMGVFTPTEAAVVAAVVRAVRGDGGLPRAELQAQLRQIFVTAAKTTAVVMFLIAAAMVSAWLITVADLPSKVVDLLQPLHGQQDRCCWWRSWCW